MYRFPRMQWAFDLSLLCLAMHPRAAKLDVVLKTVINLLQLFKEVDIYVYVSFALLCNMDCGFLKRQLLTNDKH